jgi:uncharacterized protein
MKSTFCVFNKTSQSFLGMNVTCARTSLSRLKGLLGTFRIAPGGGLWIVPSQGIHTIGMTFPIDVVYLDAQDRVIHLVEYMRPFRFSQLRLKCASVLELPPHTIYASQTKVGDQLLICSPEEVGTVVESDKPAEGEDSIAAPRTTGFSARYRSLAHHIAFARAVHCARAACSAIESCRGQSLLETALVLPLMLLMVLNTINFSTYLYAWITVNNAARAALEYQVYNGVAIGFSAVPTFAQVCAVWSQDMSSLPNIGTYTSASCSYTRATLAICSKAGTATAVCSGTGSFVPPADPTTYTLYSSDVTYTYTPFVSAFSIPVIGISLSPPPGTIERHLVMRAMN